MVQPDIAAGCGIAVVFRRGRFVVRRGFHRVVGIVRCMRRSIVAQPGRYIGTPRAPIVRLFDFVFVFNFYGFDGGFGDMNPNTKKKNLYLLIALACFAALMYGITVAKMGMQ